MFDPSFIDLLEESVGKENAAAVADTFSRPPSVSVRMNPAKAAECPFDGASPVPWSPHGYILAERPSFTLDPLFHAGCYYVQDSSAMAVGEVFRRLLPGTCQSHPRVLDLCAAPGGKTTDLAASLRERFGDGFSLVANEVIHSRFTALRNNVATWGDRRVGVLSRDPSALGSRELFDIVLADVPCSGEGMFRKDPEALRQWSLRNVEMCAARQRTILSGIWPALRPGGLLIYSTCTFNHLENDDNAAWAVGALPGARRIGLEPFAESITPTPGGGLLMLPGLVPGEGQYVAAIAKDGTPEGPVPGDIFRALGADIPAAGAPEGLPRWEIDLPTARQYLHGDALRLPEDAPSGLLTLTYRGQRLGEAKNLGKRCNNLYPKGLRIRMDV